MSTTPRNGADLRRTQAGVTLLEIVIGLTLSTLIMGVLLSTQLAAGDAFSSSMSEQKTTTHSRSGFASMRKELRMANYESFEMTNLPDGSVLRFQQAIAFDVAAGETTWGAGDDENALVEWRIEGDRLVRHYIDDQEEEIPASREILITNLDVRRAVPVELVFDDVAKNMQIQAWVRDDTRASAQARLVATVIHIEPLFLF